MIYICITTAQQKQYADDEAARQASIELATKEKEAKLKLMDAVSNGLSLAAGELGAATAAGKAAAVAAATISTYTAIAGQLQAFSKVPVPGYAIAQAIVTGATGLLQVKKILEVPKLHLSNLLEVMAPKPVLVFHSFLRFKLNLVLSHETGRETRERRRFPDLTFSKKTIFLAAKTF